MAKQKLSTKIARLQEDLLKCQLSIANLLVDLIEPIENVVSSPQKPDPDLYKWRKNVVYEKDGMLYGEGVCFGPAPTPEESPKLPPSDTVLFGGLIGQEPPPDTIK
jgi:hypothetical protein